VAIIADSGALYALYDRRDQHHRAVREAVEAEIGPIILPAAILSELDYLLRIRIGLAAELRLLEGIQQGAFAVECFTSADASYCRAILHRYETLDLGLADAAVIATAERLKILRVLTVDERDFRAVRTSSGESFVLLPADSPRKK
jgi:predicted nucleic acid-binding protein